MSDSVRMIDVAGLSKGLESFRGLDPEQRVLAERAGIRAAIRRVEEARKDVMEAERASEAEIREHGDGQYGRQEPDDSDRELADGESETDLPPEMDEGHILNIKV